ncbi:hypothetical protein LINPERPRIM_LOCUS43955 [Linum perenne]
MYLKFIAFRVRQRLFLTIVAAGSWNNSSSKASLVSMLAIHRYPVSFRNFRRGEPCSVTRGTYQVLECIRHLRSKRHSPFYLESESPPNSSDSDRRNRPEKQGTSFRSNGPEENDRAAG